MKRWNQSADFFGPSAVSSIATRNGSISLPYCTPEGQAVSQARQSRQSSKWPHFMIQLQPPVGDRPHQVDAASRAVVFVAQLDIGRARGRTQPAMDAIQEQLVVDPRTGILAHDIDSK